jgi:hypothetical protein
MTPTNTIQTDLSTNEMRNSTVKLKILAGQSSGQNFMFYGTMQNMSTILIWYGSVVQYGISV